MDILYTVSIVRSLLVALVLAAHAVSGAIVTLSFGAIPLDRAPGGDLVIRPQLWDGLVWAGTDCNLQLGVNANLNLAPEGEGPHAGKIATRARFLSWKVVVQGRPDVSLPVSNVVQVPETGQDAESAKFRVASTDLRGGTGSATGKSNGTYTVQLFASLKITYDDNTTEDWVDRPGPVQTVTVRNTVLIVGTKLNSSGQLDGDFTQTQQTLCNNAQILFNATGYTVLGGDFLTRSKSEILTLAPQFTAIFASTHGNTGVLYSSNNEAITWAELDAARPNQLYHIGFFYFCNAFQTVTDVMAALNQTTISQAVAGFLEPTSRILAENDDGTVNNEYVRVEAPPVNTESWSIVEHWTRVLNLLNNGYAFDAAVITANSLYLPRTQVQVNGKFYLDPNPMMIADLFSGATKLRHVYLTPSEVQWLADNEVAINPETMVYQSWHFVF